MADYIRILIADDFQILVEDLSETINRQSDMKVVGTGLSGQDIVKLALQTEFDIILMDIEMENLMAGITATERIRDEKKDAKIIFLTAHETKDIVITAMATGAVDYVVKGVSEEELIYHIRSAYEDKPVMKGKVQEILLQEYRRLQESEKSLLFFINNISQLTSAERELVRLLLRDLKVTEIAKERCVEVVTVKTQIKSLLRKFGCSRTKEIVKIIRELNLSHLF
ncbi:DNA-binding NarL/FixJ family response regulator [Mobilisporobacter senegalensis]|uniref:Stage 0 sporulation protein A homolog n=1 Tax=Mobilisporobacter senegalensis TaxID=1329262 RepID=A0A3N1XF30_9FIRM|nr:response regulator transcription factor [Mobilisporobacter senegalensis]ROR25314.1 DNA-binding NarL/FixJ family response regulator [Mobilisporobacter senegalensis]